MKKLLVIVALGTVFAAPAFAQQASIRGDVQVSHPMVHVYAIDHYEARHEGQSINPDRQLGSNRN